jgi:hypothetical protein
MDKQIKHLHNLEKEAQEVREHYAKLEKMALFSLVAVGAIILVLVALLYCTLAGVAITATP